MVANQAAAFLAAQFSGGERNTSGSQSTMSAAADGALAHHLQQQQGYSSQPQQVAVSQPQSSSGSQVPLDPTPSSAFGGCACVHWYPGHQKRPSEHTCIGAYVSNQSHCVSRHQRLQTHCRPAPTSDRSLIMTPVLSSSVLPAASLQGQQQLLSLTHMASVPSPILVPDSKCCAPPG
jgi:hypothetical protein